MTEPSKHCSNCKRLLPLTDFSVARSFKDGRVYRCRECVKAYMKQYRASTLGKAHTEKRRLDADAAERRNARARERRSNGEWNNARDRRHAASYRERYPEKEAAKSALNKAIKEGRVARVAICQQCGTVDPRGQDGRTLIQAHHDDYRKPLEVRWLCVACHHAVHGNVVQERSRIKDQ